MNAMWTLDEAQKEFTRQMAIKFKKGVHDERVVSRVRDILQRYPGKSEVFVLVETVDQETSTLRLRFQTMRPVALKVGVTQDLQNELNEALGEGHLQFIADVKRSSQKSQSVGR